MVQFAETRRTMPQRRGFCGAARPCTRQFSPPCGKLFANFPQGGTRRRGECAIAQLQFSTVRRRACGKLLGGVADSTGFPQPGCGNPSGIGTAPSPSREKAAKIQHSCGFAPWQPAELRGGTGGESRRYFRRGVQNFPQPVFRRISLWKRAKNMGKTTPTAEKELRAGE